MGMIRLELEIDGAEHTLVLSEEGRLLRRIPVGSEAEARGVMNRLEIAVRAKDGAKHVLTPAGEAWMRGEME